MFLFIRHLLSVYGTEKRSFMSRPPGELCDSAKRGQRCIDDLCHSGGMTLCGLDPDFLRDIEDEWDDESELGWEEDYE